MTLNELTNMMWYVQEMIILDKDHDQIAYADIEDLKSQAIFVGDNMELRSDNYKDLKGRYIQSFGAIDDFVIITLKK